MAQRQFGYLENITSSTDVITKSLGPTVVLKSYFTSYLVKLLTNL